MLRTTLKGKQAILRAGVMVAACLAVMGAAPPPPVAPGYAVLARAYLDEPIVAMVTVRGTKKLPKSMILPAGGNVRQILEADIVRVFKAPSVMNARITYLWEGPADAKGKPPSFKKQNLLVFLRPAANPEAPYQLQSASNQLVWSADAESRLRAIGLEAQKSDMRDIRLTGLQSAFTTETDPPFARLTQFLFASADNRLLGVTVRVRPDGTGDVIQSSEEFLGGGLRVQANTLLWYHLACTTPGQIPADIVSDQPTDAERALIVQDYATLKKALGPCL